MATGALLPMPAPLATSRTVNGPDADSSRDKIASRALRASSVTDFVANRSQRDDGADVRTPVGDSRSTTDRVPSIGSNAGPRNFVKCSVRASSSRHSVKAKSTVPYRRCPARLDPVGGRAFAGVPRGDHARLARKRRQLAQPFDEIPHFDVRAFSSSPGNSAGPVSTNTSAMSRSPASCSIPSLIARTLDEHSACTQRRRASSRSRSADVRRIRAASANMRLRVPATSSAETM